MAMGNVNAERINSSCERITSVEHTIANPRKHKTTQRVAQHVQNNHLSQSAFNCSLHKAHTTQALSNDEKP
jgi:hypothetical protein